MSKMEEMERKLVFQKRLEDLIADNENARSNLPSLIGIAHPTFSRAVNHGIIPKTKILIKIADYFNVPIDFLLNRTDDNNFIVSQYNNNLYDRFEELKHRKGIKTDYELAKNLHLPQQYFYDWKRKSYYPTINILEYIADYFEVSIDYLLGRTD